MEHQPIAQRDLAILKCSSKNISEGSTFIHAYAQPPHRVANLSDVVSSRIVTAPYTSELCKRPRQLEILYEVERVHRVDLLVLGIGAVVMITLAHWRRSAAAADRRWHVEAMSSRAETLLIDQALFSTSEKSVSSAD